MEALKARLALANRILAREGVVDAFGHVSIRHPDRPDRYLLSHSLSPEQVTADDIIEYDLEGQAQGDARQGYLERFIHGAVYEARPDVGAVVHHHAHEVVAFSVADTPLRPAIHVGACMGCAGIWDIRDRFGDTNMLVRDMDQARDLARALGSEPSLLMRGHGAVVVGAGLEEAVLTAIYMKVNAGVVLAARSLGEVRYLSDGEVALAREGLIGEAPMARAWAYFARRASEV